MRLKVYQAPNIGTAMALIREELGADALILASRVVDTGVEVTAAHEQLSEHVEPASANHSDLLQWHGVPLSFSEKLCNGDLVANLARHCTFAALPCPSGAPPLMFVGPSGAGKTTTTARVATRLKLSGQSPQVITADGRRAGATEQLAAFTRLLGLTLIVAELPEQLLRVMARKNDAAAVLIDMPGLSPFDKADQEYLAECQRLTGSTIALVLPAGLDPAECEDIAGGFRELGATFLVVTRLDQSRRLGSIFAAASQGLVLTEAGTGTGIADGFTAMTPAFLADRLLATMQPPASTPTGPPPVTSHPLLAKTRSESPRKFQ